MSEIRRIQQQIRTLYRAKRERAIPVPLALQAAEWTHVAEDYMACASLIDEGLPTCWLPRLQLTGHALEAALKACLAAAEVSPPGTHDLVQLYDLAAEQGYNLNEADLAALVHAGHFYYQDLSTGTKYKTRYPPTSTEAIGGAVPPNSTFQSIARSLVGQARKRRPW